LGEFGGGYLRSVWHRLAPSLTIVYY